MNKVSVHQDKFLGDLTSVLTNVFEFSELSSADMRERVQERIQMLNRKSETDTDKIREDCNWFAHKKQMEMADLTHTENRKLMNVLRKELFEHVTTKQNLIM